MEDWTSSQIKGALRKDSALWNVLVRYCLAKESS